MFIVRYLFVHLFTDILIVIEARQKIFNGFIYSAIDLFISARVALFHGKTEAMKYETEFIFILM